MSDVAAIAAVVIIAALWFALSRALARSLRRESPAGAAVERLGTKAATWRHHPANRTSMAFPSWTAPADNPRDWTNGIRN